MTCEQICQFLSDYLAGEISPSQRAAFEAHVAVCPDCRKYIDVFAKTIRTAKAAMATPADEVAQMPEDLVQAVLRAARTATSS